MGIRWHKRDPVHNPVGYVESLPRRRGEAIIHLHEDQGVNPPTKMTLGQGVSTQKKDISGSKQYILTASELLKPLGWTMKISCFHSLKRNMELRR
jgi:hypothetical protein